MLLFLRGLAQSYMLIGSVSMAHLLPSTTPFYTSVSKGAALGGRGGG